jgi:hypothetical protein
VEYNSGGLLGSWQMDFKSQGMIEQQKNRLGGKHCSWEGKI